MQNRRKFLAGTGALAAISATGYLGSTTAMIAATEEFEIMKTDAEWREILTPAQFAVLRKEETERPFTNSLLGESSPLLKEDREGTYNCAGCDLPVFHSSTKFDSGTGWPSFWDAIEGNVSYRQDRRLIWVRTEEHCRRCGGHLGHVFDDGPQPTGKRHCINGLAMNFVPA